MATASTRPSCVHWRKRAERLASARNDRYNRGYRGSQVGFPKEDSSMTYLSDAHHFRKLVAGACMMIAPLLVLVSEVIHPAEKSNAREQLTVIAGHLDRWYVAHLVAIVAIALLVPAVLGLMHMLRERE